MRYRKKNRKLIIDVNLGDFNIISIIFYIIFNLFYLKYYL